MLVEIFVLAISTYFVSTWFYRLYLSPLAHFPGPRLNACSGLPWAYRNWRGKFFQYTQDLHKKYGPVVRTGPNDLSFISAQAYQDIFGRQGGKPALPIGPNAVKLPNDAFGVFGAPEPDHSRMRKLLAHGFSPKALLAQEDLVQDRVTDLITELRARSSSNKTISIEKYASYCVFDIIGVLGFGDGFNALRDKKMQDWVAIMNDAIKAIDLVSTVELFPGLIILLPFFVAAKIRENALKVFWGAVEKSRQRIAMGVDPQNDAKISPNLNGQETKKKDILSFVLAANEDAAKDGMSIPEIEASSYILIIAGTETTASGISAAMHYLIRNPSKLEKLRHELDTTFSHEQDISFQMVESLPYLNAVIQETLRIAPPVPISPERMVDSPSGAIIDGHLVPKGTFVYRSTYASTHWPEYFAHPDDFIPERWLDPKSELFAPSSGCRPSYDSSTFVSDARAGVASFSVGPRSCLGAGLAMAELRVILGRIVWGFEFSFDMEGLDSMWDWGEQQVFSVWARREWNINISSRKDSWRLLGTTNL